MNHDISNNLSTNVDNSLMRRVKLLIEMSVERFRFICCLYYVGISNYNPKMWSILCIY